MFLHEILRVNLKIIFYGKILNIKVIYTLSVRYVHVNDGWNIP